MRAATASIVSSIVTTEAAKWRCRRRRQLKALEAKPAFGRLPHVSPIYLFLHGRRSRFPGNSAGVCGLEDKLEVRTMGGLSIWHWIIVGGVVFILFGGRFKISDVMTDVAKGIKAFKKGMAEEDEAS